MQDLIRFTDLSKAVDIGKKLGIQELILAKNFSEKELSDLKEEVKKLNTKMQFKFCLIVDHKSVSNIHKLKSKVDFVAMEGKDISTSKNALSNKLVDFLLMPFSGDKEFFDTALANLALQNKVSIVLSFSDVLNSSTSQFDLHLKNYLLLVKICKKYKVNLHVFSGARNEYEMRSTKNLSSLLSVLGMSQEEAMAAVKKEVMVKK